MMRIEIDYMRRYGVDEMYQTYARIETKPSKKEVDRLKNEERMRQEIKLRKARR